MIRIFFRIVGFLLLVGAFTALVIDGTRSIAAGALAMTPFSTTLAALAPGTLAGLKPAIDHINAFLWNPVMTHLLALPTFAVIGVLGMLALTLGQKPRPKIGYSSR